MKFFIFLSLSLFVSSGVAKPICPILKTIIKATSKNNARTLTLCDLDDHYIFSLTNKSKPEIILYKKSHEVLLTIPKRGMELTILDGIKRYGIIDNEERAYLVEIDDKTNVIIFTELNKNEITYINRSYILLNRK